MSKFDNFQFPQGGFEFDPCNAPGAPQTPLGDVREYTEQALPWELTDDEASDPGQIGPGKSFKVAHTGTPQPNQRSKGGVHTGTLPPYYY